MLARSDARRERRNAQQMNARLEASTHRNPQQDYSHYIIHINDLPKAINDNVKMVLFADDTSIIITSPNPTDFKNDKVLQDINVWFATNLLSLNLEKTQFMQFITKSNSLI
jgi:hypothetical protein